MRLLILAGLALFACDSATPAPSPSAQPSVAVTAPATRAPSLQRTLALPNGLVIDIPSTWVAAPASAVNRATYRYVFVGNGDLASLATVPGNGDVDVAALPSDRVVLAVEVFCRVMCSGPTDESPLPLDWSRASALRPGPPPAGKHELALSFRWFDDPMFVVARWGDAAPTTDVAAVERIVKSIRPDPAPPTAGEYQGWDGIGALGAFAVGTVTLRQLPPGAVIPPGVQRYSSSPYFIVRGRQNTYAFSTRPLVDQRCEIQYDPAIDRFWCQVESRRYEWTRFGRYLGPEPSSDLVQHRVILRDGKAWVRYVEGTLNVPSVADEAAEY